MIIHATRLTKTTEGNFKEYNATVEEKDGGFVVLFSYGRIGSNLVKGQKTQAPVTFEEATKIADRLIQSKLKKGYVIASTNDFETTSNPRDDVKSNVPDIEISDSKDEGVSEATFTRASDDVVNQIEFIKQSDNQKKVFSPQLLNAVTEERASFIITDDWLETYFCQIKADGERRVVRVSGGEIEAYNKRGCVVQLNEQFTDDVMTLASENDLLIDCEDMGVNGLYVFDVLQFNGVDYSTAPFENRILALKEIGHKAEYANLSNITVLLPLEINNADTLQKAIHYSKQQNEEGIVLRKGSSIYAGGRPNKEGDALKIKNINSASVIVIEHTHNKRSVSLGLYNASNQIVSVGKVTIPPNKDIPNIGAVIEVHYLYVNGEQGALFQPVFKSDRSHEVTKEECSTDQLVYKKESLQVA